MWGSPTLIIVFKYCDSLMQDSQKQKFIQKIEHLGEEIIFGRNRDHGKMYVEDIARTAPLK